MNRTIYSVSQASQLVKQTIDSKTELNQICIRGEISNFKPAPSGHLYFSIKDDQSALRCVMFKAAAVRVRFMPKNGMRVLALGRITVYPRDGVYQLYCEFLEEDGIGDLHSAFEALKKKLEAEGLFSEDHKKKLPVFPRTIGIITSPRGAAVHDMLRIIGARYPLSRVVVIPAAVQGAEAVPELIAAVRLANRVKIADVLIIGRGGGSLEDLWAFNNEQLAREIYASEIPIVSAVGHEPDHSISDYVADVAAATPSNAAELCTPDIDSLYSTIDSMSFSLENAMYAFLETARASVAASAAAVRLLDPAVRITDERHKLQQTEAALQQATVFLLRQKRGELERLRSTAYALSPISVLERGYAVVSTTAGIASTVSAMSVGESVQIRMQDGIADAQITAVNCEE